MTQVSKNLISKKLVCFISAPVDVDLKSITYLLEKRKIRVLTHNSFFQSGASIRDSIGEAIQKSDFVLAIINSLNASVYYEIGYASALRKEVIIVVPKNKNLPREFDDKYVINVDVFDNRAIGFALDQVIIRLKKKIEQQQFWESMLSPNAFINATENNEEKTLSRGRKNHPLGNETNKYLDILHSLGNEAKEQEIVKVVFDALKETGVSIVEYSRTIESGVDLALWSDEISGSYNPVLIEIKNKVRDAAQVITISQQMTEYLTQNKSRFGFVLYFKGIPPHNYLNPIIESFICFSPVDDFIRKLHSYTIGKIIKDIVKSKYIEGSGNATHFTT
jgi:nucleoside 2-deoxyribosyltransferase